jgi:hypothetical protein
VQCARLGDRRNRCPRPSDDSAPCTQRHDIDTLGAVEARLIRPGCCRASSARRCWDPAPCDPHSATRAGKRARSLARERPLARGGVPSPRRRHARRRDGGVRPAEHHVLVSRGRDWSTRRRRLVTCPSICALRSRPRRSSLRCSGPARRRPAPPPLAFDSKPASASVTRLTGRRESAQRVGANGLGCFGS